ncbi:MAG: acetamidase/formamidase family protein [Coriobacteriales bacterium]|jgi:amidase|nr:acetamidase/formamidase family protein [Coriobacteriales bacterium]
MKVLTDDQAFYAFACDMQPAMTVVQGEQFILETRDCFANQLRTDEDTLDNLDWSQINPATGPVLIDGVKPGDLVRIDIQSIELIGKSVMTTIPGAGAIDGVTEASTKVLDNDDGLLSLPTEFGEIQLPLQPMIGVIGLAPAEGSIPNGTPGSHGGNMDCRLIGEGTSLYIRAAVEGGLFGCGDVHALMGDGEVLVCGAETPARITLQATVVDNAILPTPFLETDDLYISIASAETSDEAYKMAIDQMFDFLTLVAGLSQGDAGRLMSLVGDLKFCQVVDPLITIRFEFPKAVVGQLGLSGI